MSRSRRGARGKKGTVRPEVVEAFWGAEPDGGSGVDVPAITASSDPSAMVRSLGAPPLRGHEVAAEYTFRLVYDRAAGLAATLAAAAELDRLDQDEEPRPGSDTETPGPAPSA